MNKTLCLVLLTAFAGASIFAASGAQPKPTSPGGKVKPKTAQSQPQPQQSK